MLLPALLSLAAWIRSESLHDAIRMPLGNSTATGLLSAERRIGIYFTNDTDVYRVSRQPTWETFKAETFPALFPASAGYSWSWRFREFGQLRHSSGRVVVWIIPYWSIVIPLSLLSAWLLLTKAGHSHRSNADGTRTNPPFGQ